MMLRYMGWTEAADLIIKGMDGAIGARTVTYDFARMMEGAKEVKCSEFGEAIVAWMDKKPAAAAAPARAAGRTAAKKKPAARKKAAARKKPVRRK
jgi:hypothetical protein